MAAIQAATAIRVVPDTGREGNLAHLLRQAGAPALTNLHPNAHGYYFRSPRPLVRYLYSFKVGSPTADQATGFRCLKDRSLAEISMAVTAFSK
jgi:hypothetical protein